MQGVPKRQVRFALLNLESRWKLRWWRKIPQSAVDRWQTSHIIPYHPISSHIIPFLGTGYHPFGAFFCIHRAPDASGVCFALASSLLSPMALGYPKASWMVYFMENSKIQRMITRGYPYFNCLGNLHVYVRVIYECKDVTEDYLSVSRHMKDHCTDLYSVSVYYVRENRSRRVFVCVCVCSPASKLERANDGKSIHLEPFEPWNMINEYKGSIPSIMWVPDKIK